MHYPALTANINEAKAANISSEKITEDLLAAGWNQDDIAEALAAYSSAPVAPQAPVAVGVQSEEVLAMLPGSVTLLKEAWGLYIGKLSSVFTLALPIAGIVLLDLFVLPRFFGEGVGVGFQGVLLALGVGFVAVVYGIIFAISLILLYSNRVSNPTEAILVALKKLGSYLWIMTLSGLIGMGGMFVFVVAAGLIGGVHFIFQYSSTPLPVPLEVVLVCTGFVVALWVVIRLMLGYTFAAWVFVEEDIRGIAALQRSAYYVGPRFGAVLFRFWPFLLIGFAFGLVSGLLFALHGSETQSVSMAMSGVNQLPIGVSLTIQLLQVFLVTPFFLAYMQTLFLGVKRSISFQKPQQAPRRGVIVGLAVAGFLLPFLISSIIAVIVLASLNTARSAGQDVALKAGLSMMRVQLEMYAAENGDVYPQHLEDALVNRGNISTDKYRYLPSEDKKSYSLCVTLTNTKDECVEGVIENLEVLPDVPDINADDLLSDDVASSSGDSVPQ